jgi:hypothetical protein
MVIQFVIWAATKKLCQVLLIVDPVPYPHKVPFWAPSWIHISYLIQACTRSVIKRMKYGLVADLSQSEAAEFALISASLSLEKNSHQGRALPCILVAESTSK